MNAPSFIEGLTKSDPTIDHAVEIVSAYVAHNPMPPSDLPGFIASMHAAIVGLGKSTDPTVPSVTKATSAEIEASITPDALISFEDGKPYKALKRHLTKRGLTPEAYRAKHGLPAAYPMVAASYSGMRSALAKSLGLGRPATAKPAAA